MAGLNQTSQPVEEEADMAGLSRTSQPVKEEAGMAGLTRCNREVGTEVEEDEGWVEPDAADRGRAAPGLLVAAEGE